jgi:hypothetical protein
VADSGATHHTTPSVGNISTLHPLASSNPSFIVVGNGSSLPITSVDDSFFHGSFYLNNILLAPDMVQSLLSIRHFTIDNWCSMEFDPFGLSVKDLTTKNVIVRSNSTGLLYTMHLPGSLTPSSSIVAALAAVPHALTAVAPTTWHRRLGHPGPGALSSLSRSSFIQCTNKKRDFCRARQLGKHTRLPFCSSSFRVEHPFDLIHLDLWTSPVVSVSGSKYYLVILDDFTHYLWTFPLKLNSDTFTNLSHIFAYVPTQFGRTVKAIQCDNGCEFDNSSTRFFLLSNGTQLQISCPYMSPQNGKVERIIRSVNNVIRTLLIQASLLGRYWAEGLHTATYLLKCLPITAIQAACPHLALLGSTPSYEHLCVFACTCYPNTTATAPHKLSPRSTWCVFQGYSADHKGYCCLDLLTNCLIVSQNVVFDEDNFPLSSSPSLTDLDFLCESGPMVSTIGTHLTTTGTFPPAPRQPAPEIPPSFEPPMANLPAPVVPPGFLPRAATTAAPPPITIGLPPRTWPASPVTYVRWEVGARAAGTRGAPGASLSREVEVRVAGTRGAPGAALCREAGAGVAGTHGTLGAALCQEVCTGAAGTCGAPGATPSRVEGANAMGTRGTPGAALSPEVNAEATGTCGAPGATLSWAEGTAAMGAHGTPEAALSLEVGTGVAGTRGAPGAALRREVGARVVGTHGAPGATLRREVGARAVATRGSPRAALS